MKLIEVKPSNDGIHKYVAMFQLDDGTLKHVKFGSKGMSDFTKHGDEKRKNAYIARHKVTEDWNNPLSAGALSRWLLWNKKTLNSSILDFKHRFNL